MKPVTQSAMGGSNPYIKSADATLPNKKYKLTFKGATPETDRVIIVEPTGLPASGSGQAGSVLDIAMANGIDLEHACGGVCACSTCHVYVSSGIRSCSPATEDEDDQLEKAPGISPRSRLACQCVPNGSEDIVIEVPALRRNLVREGS